MDIWSILIVILIAQGLFNLSLLIRSSIKRSEPRNKYLIFITLALIWFLIEFLSVRQTFKVPVNLFYGTRYGSWFLLGPLTFYFFQTITKDGWKFQWKSTWHLLPFLIFTVLVPILSNESLSYRQIHYGMLAVFDYRPKTVTPFEYLYSTIFYVQFIHLGLYLLYNLFSIRRYVTQLKNQYSSIKNLVWMKIFNGLLIGILVLVSAYLYILFQSDVYERSLDYIYVVPIGLFIYALSYKLSNQNWLPVKEVPKYNASTLKTNERSNYAKQLDQLMIEEKPYLKNDLRLKDIAALLEMSHHHVSQLINEHYDCSFFDFINRYRVKEAEQLMAKFPKNNLLQVAFDAGFNNKTSFNNAFKKFNGKTPSEYRKSLKQ